MLFGKLHVILAAR